MQCTDGDTVFEYMVQPGGSGWLHWKEQVPAWLYPKDVEQPPYSQLIVPTMESVRYEKLLSLLHSVNKASPSRHLIWPSLQLQPSLHMLPM